jgi:hypothetical protein
LYASYSFDFETSDVSLFPNGHQGTWLCSTRDFKEKLEIKQFGERHMKCFGTEHCMRRSPRSCFISNFSLKSLVEHSQVPWCPFGKRLTLLVSKSIEQEEYNIHSSFSSYSISSVVSASDFWPRGTGFESRVNHRCFSCRVCALYVEKWEQKIVFDSMKKRINAWSAISTSCSL